MSNIEDQQEGLKWQVGVWDRISPIYLRKVDSRFTEVVDSVIRHAGLPPGQQVLDLGIGTGSVAVRVASSVIPGGRVTAVDTLHPHGTRLQASRQLNCHPGGRKRQRPRRARMWPMGDGIRQFRNVTRFIIGAR